MNGSGGWFRNFSAKVSGALQHFWAGRNGNDRLNMYILGTGAVIAVIHLFLPTGTVKLVLWALTYVLLIWAIFRAMSRNTYKRYQENRKFLQFLDRFKDRQHRYYDCPKCRQTVRVPRGKGKIAITCPKCHEKFIRKT